MKRISWAIPLVLIIGCSQSIRATKPNTTYLYNIPSIAQFSSSVGTKNIKKTTIIHEEKVHQLFERIFEFDQQLAIELGRIPEFQDGVNEREIFALEKFVNFLSVSTDNEKRAFKEILTVGRPEYRKFCSPLQGLFWLAEKGELTNGKNPLKNYSLERLLDRAWTFEPEYTKEEAISIIRNWKDKEAAARLLNGSEDDIKRLNSMVNDFKIYLKRNSFEDRNIFKKYKALDRWNDSNMVMDRLNSPELFEYWFAHNFRYDWSKFWITTPTAYPQSAEMSIKTKTGICFDAAYLAYVCLKRAGYDVTGLNVWFVGRARSGAIMHSVCVLKKEEFNEIKFYKLGDTNTAGRIVGPYNSIQRIAEDIASGHGVPLKRYLTGLPYYDYYLWAY